MVNKTDGDEYFFDDADIEHLGTDDSDETVIYEHEGDSSSVDDPDEYEAPNQQWEKIKKQAIVLLTENKRIILICVVVAAALAGVHYLLPSAKHQGSSQTSSVHQVQNKKAPLPVSFDSTSAPVAQHLLGVSTQVSKQSMAIKTLAQAMDGIIDKQDNNEKQMTALLQRIDRLSAQLASPSKPQGVSKKSVSHAGKRHLVPRVTFYVRAVQPGRAWLLGSDHASISVSIGSIIPGYGKVIKIDADSGQVFTEGGQAIGFSPEQIP